MKKHIYKWKKSILSVALAISMVLSPVAPAAEIWAEEAEVEAPHVLFTAADGRTESICEGGTITINELEEGRFSMAGYEQDAVKWSCSETITDGKESTKHNIIQAYTGDFQGSGGQGPYTAYVSDALTGKRLLTFTLATTPTNLEEIRLYVDGQEAPVGQVFEGLGSSLHYLTAKGRVAGEEEFRDIPNRVLSIAVDPSRFDDSFDRVTWSFAVPGDNNITYQVFVTDAPNVTTSVMAGSVHVPVTGISVRVPEQWEIHAWNGIFGDYYVGINAGDEDDHYSVSIEPWDASNKEVVWEALTPDIAEFMTQHGNGIVPKKQGLAQFRVHSAENADIYQDVEINFVYKNPLKSAVIDGEITIEEGSTLELPLKPTPANASEQRFTWTYSQDGIVTVSDTVSNDPSSVLIEKTTTHTLSGKKKGTVTVTGTPLDTTAGCEPVVFDVTVVEKTVVEPVVDALTAARSGIAKGLSWLNTASVNKYGSEWNIITLLRSGDFITAQDKVAYLESVAAQAAKLSSPTDLARVILAIGAMNEDPTEIGGVNLVEKLYSFDKMGSQLSNGPVWALIALDSKSYAVPADAVCTRESLINQILSYVCADGGFGLYGNSSSSLDMTGMALTALAPYNTDLHPEVQAAVEGALSYLADKMTDTCGFVEGGSENSCTAAQVLTALSALGIDTEKDARFSRGNKNIVSNLMTFASNAGGFKTYASDGDNVSNGMATYQTTYALAAYKRFRSGEPSLYDFSDAGQDTAFRVSRSEVTINVGEQIVLTPLNYPNPDANRFAFWWDTKDSKVVALYSGYMSINQTVYAKAVGDATITVTYNGYDPATDRDILLKATCLVHVVDPSAEPDPDDAEKTAVVSVEKFTLGQGYLVEPMVVTYPASWNAAQVLDKVLKEQGFEYEYKGELDGGFYLSSICDADDGSLDIPDCISHMTDRQGNLLPNLPDNDRNAGNEDLPHLGEFDYSPQSGWMYSVNDVFPDLGFSEKYLEDGDVMRVQFTLVGLGADLGASGGDAGVQPLPVGDKTALTVDMAQINGDLSGWYGSVGSSERYEYGMKILCKVDATQEEINLARKVLKGQAQIPSDEPVQREGTCGDHLTWKLDEEGVLTIEGTG
ncbi:MAG: DUF4430 domain-containing protein, partial [Lachnospiraceae bacterium]|nr:DUF4430 domain-containing protein [Lachnospiraceae bacterium]